MFYTYKTAFNFRHLGFTQSSGYLPEDIVPVLFEFTGHYSSAILDIEEPHDVTTLVIVFSLEEAINKYVECSNPTEFVCIYFLHKLRSVEENFIEI